MAVVWHNKWKWDTGYSADSVEWCPVAPHQDILVCGTYQLDNLQSSDQASKQKRLGRIHLFVINEHTTELAPIQTLETAGILDQKWCYHAIQSHAVLAVVTSEGFLQLYRLVEEGTLSLKLWLQHAIGGDVLALSLDWSTNRATCDEPRIVVSDSSGGVTVLRVAGEGLHEIGTWKTHGFEAWIAAFNYWNTDLFYSGGDDCVFKSYDVRVPETGVATNRSHEAGVTAVRSHVDVEHQLLTGSYDEKVRLWDARYLKRCVSETDVNGGVWRLKWHPFKPDTVLAACMYGGFRILQSQPDMAVVGEYLEHGSIAYGMDWKFDDKLCMVATCSFYDCKLHICEVVMK